MPCTEDFLESPFQLAWLKNTLLQFVGVVFVGPAASVIADRTSLLLSERQVLLKDKPLAPALGSCFH